MLLLLYFSAGGVTEQPREGGRRQEPAADEQSVADATTEPRQDERSVRSNESNETATSGARGTSGGLDAAIRSAASRNAARAGQQADSSYRYNWERYKRFVNKKRAEGVIPAGPKYLTRRNVDFFFQEFVAQMTVEPKTAARIRPALQFYADRLEWILEPFEVDSTDVRSGLSSQVVTYINNEIGRRIDPHSNLPSTMLSDEDHTNGLHTMLSKNYPQWQSLGSSWTIGMNSFVRCDTFLKLRLPNIILNKTHGLKLPDGSIEPMIAFILNAGDMKGGGGGPRGGRSKKALEIAREKAKKSNKKKSSNDDEEGGYSSSKKKRMTGLWRHKEWLRCGTGMLATSLFTLLYHERRLNFFDDDPERQPLWWKKKIWGQWKDTRVAGTAYSRLLRECNISWGKVIHMRSAGIEYASSQGELDGGTVGTMSKHQGSKLEKVYMTELFPSVLRVMSGIKKDDVYYVPRTVLKLPWTPETVTTYIFPKVHLWRTQFTAPNGDHSLAAQNFLDEALPYLAKVVVQDGIYWLRDYPSHEVSKLLLNTMPPEYERWAAGARQEIDTLLSNKQSVLTSDLNDAAKAALLTVLDRVDEKFGHHSTELATLTRENRLLRESVTSLVRVLEHSPEGGNVLDGTEVTENRLIVEGVR